MLGGDGRNNQILLALWKAKSERDFDPDNEVIFYCIEEPEAHLHPHQQRLGHGVVCLIQYGLWLPPTLGFLVQILPGYSKQGTRKLPQRAEDIDMFSETC